MSVKFSENQFDLKDSSFVKKLELTGIGLFVVGGIASLVAALVLEEHAWEAFLESYLYAYIYVLGITATCMFFSALQFLTNAGWSALVRRVAELFTPFIFVIAIGMLPIIFDVLTSHHLYHHWLDPQAHEVGNEHYDPVIVGKSWYLNPTFFCVRLIAYVLVWLAMYFVIVKNSFKQDTSADDQSPTRKNKVLSAIFVMLYALSTTFAAFDLIMSLDPHWFSTMFGVYFFAGNFVTTLSLIAIFTVLLKEGGYLPQITSEHYHDLGKFMFAFTVFWTYIGFSQFMLIWYANLPEETLFYQERLHHGWQYFFYALIVFHFIVPFSALLSQKAKRNPRVLIGVGLLIMVMHAIDLAWYIMPSFSPHGFRYRLLDLGLLLLFAGLFLFWAARQYKSHKAVAVNDPFMRESLELVS